MGKVRLDALSNNDRVQYLDALYTAASSVQGRADIKEFLRDLLTPSERIMLGRRIHIARMLIVGTDYDRIQGGLHVGRDTIARVHRWLLDSIPGYERAIRGLEENYAQRKTIRSIDRTSLMFKLKKKYPLHFLFFRYPKKKSTV